MHLRMDQPLEPTCDVVPVTAILHIHPNRAARVLVQHRLCFCKADCRAGRGGGRHGFWLD